MNSIFNHDVAMAEDRRRRFENEAEIYRLTNAYLNTQPGWWSHMLYNVGSALVVTGTRLKSRYEGKGVLGAPYTLRNEVFSD